MVEYLIIAAGALAIFTSFCLMMPKQRVWFLIFIIGSGYLWGIITGFLVGSILGGVYFWALTQIFKPPHNST